jgi:hypothetical protein
MLPVADKNKLRRFMWAAILVLTIIIGILGYLNSRGEKLEEGSITLKAGHEIIGVITLDQVKQLPVVNKKMAISSTAGLSKHNFTCTPLRGAFDQVDPQIVERYQRVITRGVDNYVSGVTMEEVLEKNNVFLVYADNDQPLRSKIGGKDTMRIVIMNDSFGQRFTNYLVEIELE